MPTIADLTITSSQFGPDGRLEDRNAYDRDNVPPPLAVSGAPAVLLPPRGWKHA